MHILCGKTVFYANFIEKKELYANVKCFSIFSELLEQSNRSFCKSFRILLNRISHSSIKMLTFDVAEGARHRAFISESYKIEEKQAVRTISSSRTQILSPNLPFDEAIFPSAFYASNYEAPEKSLGSLPMPMLSPRQEEALVKHAPPRPSPMLKSGAGNAPTAFMPIPGGLGDFHSLAHARTPQGYADMVGAKANRDVKYGDYPELKGLMAAAMNFGTEPARFKATADVNNAKEGPWEDRKIDGVSGKYESEENYEEHAYEYGKIKAQRRR